MEVTRWHAIFTHSSLTVMSEIPKTCVGKFNKEVIKHNLDEFLAKVKKTTNLQADTLIDPDQSPFWKKRNLSHHLQFLSFVKDSTIPPS